MEEVYQLRNKQIGCNIEMKRREEKATFYCLWRHGCSWHAAQLAQLTLAPAYRPATFCNGVMAA